MQCAVQVTGSQRIGKNKNMKIKDKLVSISKAIDDKSLQQFGFRIRDVTLLKVMDYMYERKDSSSLAVTRILFGLAMVFDVADERGGATMDKRWANPKTCHFPLISWIRALPMPFMALVYAGLWIGAFGIMLGYKYRVTAPMFTICYWYLFLIEKSYWNNHSYLFGLVALLLSCTDANCFWSLDVYFKTTQKKTTVPYWNYFILKYQFFILYFMAGMKKGTAEWLTGYSVQNLSEHWVFDPFKMFLTVEQTDYLIVHWFIFVFDLTIALWMTWSQTRHIAMIFCALFHFMNSRLFAIGMFPWVCLATMPLFYPFDWPHVIINYFLIYYRSNTSFICKKYHDFRHFIYTTNKNDGIECKDNINENNLKDEVERVDQDYNREDNGTNDMEIEQNVIENKEKSDESFRNFNSKELNPHELGDKNECKHKRITLYLILFYMFIQAFLPYSHFITKGYNNWTNGLYGYSWDMMVHTWDTQSVVVKIVDNENNKEFFIDPYVYTPNDRWTKHSDMVHQYARCLENNLLADAKQHGFSSKKFVSENISVYIDVWCSMNGRFVQRVFDPNVDLLKANWSPFRSSSYLMPLLDEALSWRTILDGIRKDVHSWTNYSDVVFFADFPGYFQEKYIPNELYNVTFIVLEGQIAYEPEISSYNNRQSFLVSSGDRISVESGLFHKILNIGTNPAFYMYTFNNSTSTEINNDNNSKPKLPISKEIHRRLAGMILFVNLVVNYAVDFLLYLCPCQ